MKLFVGMILPRGLEAFEVSVVLLQQGSQQDWKYPGGGRSIDWTSGFVGQGEVQRGQKSHGDMSNDNDC